MSDTQWQQVKRLFCETIEQEPDNRAEFLKHRCSGNRDLAAAVNVLLDSDRNAKTFLTDLGVSAIDLCEQDASGLELENYRLKQIIGEGGMGVVYLATQRHPERLVALKLLKYGFLSPELARRFHREIKILGRLDHRHIARIYDAGSVRIHTHDQPYYAMELVQGRTLTDYAQATHLSIHDRLRLLVTVCNAVQYAHQKGVIHRDLKPANILVDENNQPKILDFGVSRLIDDDREDCAHTTAGQQLGTLPYMSPEQFSITGHQVDTRSDVYALGIIGYELLAGALPYRVGKTPLMRVMNQIAHTEPQRLGQRNRKCRGEIETIINKAMEKSPELRYQSAADFAADIRRHLKNEPIQARPATLLYQSRKLFVRHRAALLIAAAIALAAVTGVWQIGVLRVRAQERTTQAEQLNELLNAVFRSSPWAVNATPEASIKRISNLANRIDNRFDNAPETKALGHDLISLAFEQQADYDAAARHLRIAHTLRGTLEQTPFLEALTTLGSRAQWSGAFDKSRTLFEEALRISRQHYGDAHINTMDCQRKLGGLAWRLGDYAHAERQFRSLLETMGAVYAQNHPEVVHTRNSLGVVLRDLNQFEEAEEVLTGVLEQRMLVLGEDNLYVAAALNNLGRLYYMTNQDATALSSFQRAFEISNRLEKPSSFVVSEALVGKAMTTLRMGDVDQALSIAQRSLTMRQRRGGDWLIGESEIVLGNCLVAQQEYERAENYILSGYDHIRESVGDQTTLGVRAKDAIRGLYTSWGQLDKLSTVLCTDE